MKIKVKLDVSEIQRTIYVDNKDLGIDDKDWENLKDSAKHDAIVDYVNELPDQPFWCIGTINEF